MADTVHRLGLRKTEPFATTTKTRDKAIGVVAKGPVVREVVVSVATERHPPPRQPVRTEWVTQHAGPRIPELGGKQSKNPLGCKKTSH